MSTSLCWSPHCQPGPFSAFTATCKYPYHNQSHYRVTVNGDPFFFSLRSLRMAINRLSSQTYSLKLNLDKNEIEYASRSSLSSTYRDLTLDDFFIELITYTPTVHPFDPSLPGKTTPTDILGASRP